MTSILLFLWVVTGCGGGSATVRPTVIIEEGQLIIYDELSSDEVPLQIRFEVDSAVIGEESHRPLEVLAEFMNGNPNLRLVEVHGHTDEQSTPAYNLRLSRRRANAVVRFLVEAGVDQARLRARGFGNERPIARGTSPEAQAQNRRVEFVIVTER
jgi:outer membrane protein OmpA-like peptidoglycan-associated protein